VLVFMFVVAPPLRGAQADFDFNEVSTTRLRAKHRATVVRNPFLDSAISTRDSHVPVDQLGQFLSRIEHTCFYSCASQRTKAGDRDSVPLFRPRRNIVLQLSTGT
jgi:hypothetical protein